MGATKNGVVPAVLAYLIAHQGEVLAVDTIARGTGLDPQQVKTGMYRLIRAEKWPVETIQKGHLWKVGEADPQDISEDDGTVAAFDVVERLGDALVLADGDGGLWLAKRIGRAER